MGFLFCGTHCILFDIYCIMKGVILPGREVEQDVPIVLLQKNYFFTTKPNTNPWRLDKGSMSYPHLFHCFFSSIHYCIKSM